MLIITFYMIEMGNIFLLLDYYILAKFSIEIILDKTLIWTTWKTAYSLLVKDFAAAWDAPLPFSRPTVYFISSFLGGVWPND